MDGSAQGQNTPVRNVQEVGRIERAGQVCEAFPNGIPRAVFDEEVDHFRENYPGDNGMLGIPEEE